MTERRIEIYCTDGTALSMNRASDIRSDHKHGYLTYTEPDGSKVTINLDQVRWFKIGDPK
jgi:hypothetical protein